MPSIQELNRKRQELETAKKEKIKQLRELKSQMADAETGDPGPCYLSMLGRVFDEARGIAEDLKQIKKEIFSIL